MVANVKSNLFFLLQGNIISKAGSALFDIALVLWLKEHLGTGTAIGIIMMLSNIPEIVLSPFCGAIVDLTKKKRVLVYADLVSGIIIVTIGIICYMFPENTVLLVVLLITGSMLLGVCSSFFNPAVRAIIPELVAGEKLQSVNSLYNFSSSAAQFAGQCFGGILFTMFGAPILFIVNGLSYLFASASEACIKGVSTNQQSTGSLSMSVVKNNFKEGLLYIKNNYALKTFLFIICLYHFFISPFTVIMPFYVTDYLKLSQSVYGFFPGALGAGLLSGFLFAGIFKFTGRKRVIVMQCCFLFPAACFLLLGSLKSIALILPLIYLIGAAVAIIIVNLNTIIQLSTPTTMHGRIFGLYHTVSAASIPVGMGIFGFILDIMRNVSSDQSQSSAIVFLLCGITLFLVWLLFIVHPRFRALLLQITDTSTR